MKGLILKDFHNITKQYKILLILFAFYLIGSVSSKDADFFGSIITILMTMQVITAMAYDEKSNWNRYALTMPISRSDLVLSKYLLGCILLAISFAANFIFQIFAGPGTFTEALLSSFATTGLGLFFIFLILPFLFKFGVEKGRYVTMLIIFILSAILMLASSMKLTLPWEVFIKLLPLISVIVLILSGVISVKLSIAVLEKKEM